MKQEYITIISKRVKKKIRIADILYIIKSEYLSLLHLLNGDVLQTITPIYELKEMLGDDCIEVKKGCIVSVSAITNGLKPTNSHRESNATPQKGYTEDYGMKPKTSTAAIVSLHYMSQKRKRNFA